MTIRRGLRRLGGTLVGVCLVVASLSAAIVRQGSQDLGLDPAGAGLNYPVNASSNLLVACIFGDIGADNLTSVSYAGTTQTVKYTEQGTGDRRIWLAYWTTPATGTNAFSFSWSVVPGHFDVIAADYSGINAFVDEKQNPSTGANITVAPVAAATTDWALACHREFAGVVTTWTGVTNRQASNGLHYADSGAGVGATGAYTIIANSGGNASALIGVLFSEAGGASPTSHPCSSLRLLGVGCEVHP